MMRIKEVAIGDPAVTAGSCQRGTAQHELVDHELAIVFAKCALNGPITGIRRVGAAGPLPDDPERIIEMPGARGNFPFHFGRQVLAAPPRERIRLVITDMADGRGGIDPLQPGETHDTPLPIDLAPMTGRLPAF